jgi:hypothetical protein
MSMLVCGRPGARGLSSVPATLRASGTEGCVPGTVVMARDERPAALSESGPWRTGLFRASRSEDHEAGHVGLTNPMVGRQGGLITFAPGGKVMSTAWVVLAVAASMFGGAAAEAADGTTANDQNVSKQELLKRLETMERRVQTLETQLKQQNQAAPASPARNRKGSASAKEETAAPGDGSAMAAAAAAAAMTPTSANDKLGPLPSVAPALKFGMYGELKFGSLQNPAANGQWQNGFDAARVVLLPTYQFTDNIVFNAEIEFEHAGSGFDNDDKLHGTAEIEQAFVDFQFSEHLNWRAPGVDLVPISYYNLYHEPTLFYSVNRPELVNGLIPSTWSAGATALYGKIVDGLNYEFQISQSLEDFGDDFGLRTDANTPRLFPQGYLPGIDGIDALANAKAPLGDFRQLNNSLAYTGRLSYSPPFLPGFAGSTAVYYSPNTTPRGAYADFLGLPLGSSTLFIVDTEGRYRIPNTGFELRGEYDQVWFGNPANLRANNDTDPTDNVGKTMYGFFGEIDYHFRFGPILNQEWEAVPFYRYTYENLQTGGFAGTDQNLPTGQGQRQFHTMGFAVFPTPELVLKLTYQKVLDRSPLGPQADSILGGVGWLF